MEHISLYRKWRPQDFSEVVGQKHVTKTLANAIEGGRVVHAYLFCGPRGTGKTSVARILAKTVNCEKGPTPTPCNECAPCREISAGTSLDVIEIDAASNRGIDEIRDLREKIIYAPASYRKKVYIIDEVHMLTTEASNALLKMMEEPPGHVIFVLATTEPNRVLPTIVSRCQRFDFWPIPANAIADHLADIAAEESIEIDKEALEMIAEHARGSIRDGIGVLDQISSMGEERITANELASLLGAVESELVFAALDIIKERDTTGALELTRKLEREGKDNRKFVAELIDYLHNIFLIHNSRNPRDVVDATDDHFSRLQVVADCLQEYEVLRLMELMGRTYKEMRWDDDPRLLLEIALVKAARPTVDVTLEGLEYRVTELERHQPGVERAGQVSERGDGTGMGGEEPPSMGEGSNATWGGRNPGDGSEGDQQGDSERGIDYAGDGGGLDAADERDVEKGTGGDVSQPLHEDIKRAWSAVLSRLKREDISVYALLMSARVMGYDGHTLEVGFPSRAAFQRSKLEDTRERAVLDSALHEVLGPEVEMVLTGEEPVVETGGTSGKEEVGGEPELAVGETDVTEREGESGKPGKVEALDDTRTEDEIIRMVKEGLDGEVVE